MFSRLQNIVRFVTGKLEKWNEVIDSFAKGVVAGFTFNSNGGEGNYVAIL